MVKMMQTSPALVLALVALLLAVPTFAEAADTAAESRSSSPDGSASGSGSGSSSAAAQDAAATAAPAASGPLSKLTIHGYLTQAYATSDFLDGRLPAPDGSDPGPTAEEIVLGIPEDGTTNYRNMALQFRYEITKKDIMVVQLSSRALGDSPINDIEDDIELDWAFYERRLTDQTSVKVGRVQIPLGIFNEFRDVGTILPFYRPPFVFYREGTFTSETVDGALVSHTFNAQSDWALDFDVYAGEWESFELSFFDQSVTIARNEGYGFQLWLSTPIYGLRFGLGGHHRDVTGGSEGAVRLEGATSKFDDWYFSLDGVFDRFIVRGEYREFEGDPEPVPAFAEGIFVGTVQLYYGQVGFIINDHWKVFAQAEFQATENEATTFTRSFDVTLREDFALSLVYLFSPNVVLKAEYHEVEGKDIGFIPIFQPTGVLLLDPVLKDIDGGNYAIVSLSASF